MHEGETGVIAHIGGPSLFKHRLMEMGILKGTEVYVEKYAPLKDPMEIIVKGYHVSLRVEEAHYIDIEKKHS